jgi:diacylglycerol kinase (ATP)
MKTCVIINPNAGSAGEIELYRERLERIPETGVRLTEKEGDARRIAAEALESGVELIVAAGGDGTLNEVLNGLAADFSRARLGLLPLGTGNDFARSINVPADFEGALAVLLEGRAQALDVGRASFGEQSRYFINMSAGGFSSMVSEKADEAKDRWGPLAYMRAALGTLPELQGFKALFTVNGVERLEIETYNVIVSNGRFVAAGIPVAPHSKLDDGLLDVMIVPAVTGGQITLLVPQVLLGLHLDSDLIHFRKVTRLEIVSDPPMVFNLDGEVIGACPASFEILPRALEVIVGPETEDAAAT